MEDSKELARVDVGRVPGNGQAYSISSSSIESAIDGGESLQLDVPNNSQFHAPILE